MELTEFGQVLAEFMGDKEIAVTPDEIRALAERAGLDPESLLARVTGSGEHEGYLDEFANELGLGDSAKWPRLALAYTFAHPRKDIVEYLGPGGHIGMDRHEAELMAVDHDLWLNYGGLVPMEDEEAAAQWGQAADLAWDLAGIANNRYSPLCHAGVLSLMGDAAVRAQEAERRAMRRLEKKKALKKGE